MSVRKSGLHRSQEALRLAAVAALLVLLALAGALGGLWTLLGR